jgi:hypothetical protein
MTEWSAKAKTAFGTERCARTSHSSIVGSPESSWLMIDTSGALAFLMPKAWLGPGPPAGGRRYRIRSCSYELAIP